jgi:hypothetical protein
MSKSTWGFRPTALRRAVRAIQSMGLKPRAFEFSAEGGFRVFIDDPEERTDLLPTETSDILRKLI